MAKNTEKLPNPSAPLSAPLPNLPIGQVWDTVEIADWDFAIPVAENMKGILDICKGDEAVAAKIFNRALRIKVPADLDARKVMSEAKDKAVAARDLQVQVLAFDVTAKAERSARKPKTVDVSEVGESISKADLVALLAKHGIKTA